MLPLLCETCQQGFSSRLTVSAATLFWAPSPGSIARASRTGLESLDLGNTQVTEAGIKDLMEALPETRIVR